MDVDPYTYEGVVSSPGSTEVDVSAHGEAYESPYENPYESQSQLEVPPRPAEVRAVIEMIRPELGYRPGEGQGVYAEGTYDLSGLPPNKIGDATAVFRLTQLFNEGGNKPPGYQEDEDPVEYLKRQVKELEAQDKLLYRDPGTVIENVGRDESDYYVYSRALRIYNELSQYPYAMRVGIARGELDPGLSARMFADMRR